MLRLTLPPKEKPKKPRETKKSQPKKTNSPKKSVNQKFSSSPAKKNGKKSAKIPVGISAGISRDISTIFFAPTFSENAKKKNIEINRRHWLLYVYPFMPTKSPKTQYTQPTQAQLKQAYTLVTEHLAQALIKAQPNQTVRFGKLGSFKKTENQITSRLHNKKGIRYAYYRLLFKPFSGLKQELNQALEKKYNR